MPRIVAIVVICLSSALARGEDWPEFRGPTGQGVSAAKDLPLEWSESQNVVWKIDVPGLGWSSPSIAAGQLWLTTATDEAKSLRALCYDPNDGHTLHDVEVFRLDEAGAIHSKNSHASPTPVIAGDRVYVHFGAYGTACLTTDGHMVWKNGEIKYNHRHGPGGSPVLYEDLLIFSCDGTDVAFVVALDAKTGDVRWKKIREGPMAYSTPLLIRVGEKDQLVSTGGDQAIAYDPRTGDEIWKSKYDGFSCIPRPVYGHGLVFLCSGYNTPHLWAVRPDGAGDVTETHVAWKMQRGAPHSPSPVLVGNELYMVNDAGIATCVDAKTGKQLWQKRLDGGYSASLLAVEGRIYATNEAGKTTVFAPGTEYKELTVNQIEGRTLASLAAYGKSIFLRSDKHLYRLEAKQP